MTTRACRVSDKVNRIKFLVLLCALAISVPSYAHAQVTENTPTYPGCSNGTAPEMCQWRFANTAEDGNDSGTVYTYNNNDPAPAQAPLPTVSKGIRQDHGVTNILYNNFMAAGVPVACRYIDNNNATQDLFVPQSTLNEFKDFVNTFAGQPNSNITFGYCTQGTTTYTVSSTEQDNYQIFGDGVAANLTIPPGATFVSATVSLPTTRVYNNATKAGAQYSPDETVTLTYGRQDCIYPDMPLCNPRTIVETRVFKVTNIANSSPACANFTIDGTTDCNGTWAPPYQDVVISDTYTVDGTGPYPDPFEDWVPPAWPTPTPLPTVVPISTPTPVAGATSTPTPTPTPTSGGGGGGCSPINLSVDSLSTYTATSATFNGTTVTTNPPISQTLPSTQGEAWLSGPYTGYIDFGLTVMTSATSGAPVLLGGHQSGVTTFSLSYYDMGPLRAGTTVTLQGNFMDLYALKSPLNGSCMTSVPSPENFRLAIRAHGSSALNTLPLFVVNTDPGQSYPNPQPPVTCWGDSTLCSGTAACPGQCETQPDFSEWQTVKGSYVIPTNGDYDAVWITGNTAASCTGASPYTPGSQASWACDHTLLSQAQIVCQ